MHPENSRCLCPCIAVTNESLVVYFYDTKHDVLLESSPIRLVSGRNNVGEVNLVAILTSWLVLNYKYLCSGLVEDLKEQKAGFFAQAKQN